MGYSRWRRNRHFKYLLPGLELAKLCVGNRHRSSDVHQSVIKHKVCERLKAQAVAVVTLFLKELQCLKQDTLQMQNLQSYPPIPLSVYLPSVENLILLPLFSRGASNQTTTFSSLLRGFPFFFSSRQMCPIPKLGGRKCTPSRQGWGGPVSCYHGTHPKPYQIQPRLPHEAG